LAEISGRLENADVDEIAVLRVANDTRHEVNQSSIICGGRMGADIDLIKLRSPWGTMFVDHSRHRHCMPVRLSPHYDVAWCNATKRSIPPPTNGNT